MRRREARAKVLQALYQMDLTHHSLQDAASSVLEEMDEGEDTGFFHQLLQGVEANLSELDERLKPHLQNWSLERLAVVERNVLRIGAFELLGDMGTPRGVALNEAVELAKTFGSDESARLVNGVLSSLAASLQGAEGRM